MHKRSWFPYITFLLSLILVGLIIFSFVSKSSTEKTVSATPTVSESEYQSELQKHVSIFSPAYAAATSDADRTAAVQTMMNSLLSMHVPADDKDLHLELALSLQSMKDALASGKDASDGFTRFKTAVTSATWLHL